MLDSFLFYAGFFLIFFLCSEECHRLIAWGQALTRRGSWHRWVIYPLAVLATGIALLIIGNSLVRLFTSVRFSYD